jgi:hypothetical protein
VTAVAEARLAGGAVEDVVAVVGTGGNSIV